MYLKKLRFALAVALFMQAIASHGANGYQLWPGYPAVNQPVLKQQYASIAGQTALSDQSATGKAIRHELQLAPESMLGKKPGFVGKPAANSTLIIILRSQLNPSLAPGILKSEPALGDEAFVLHKQPGQPVYVVAETEIGLLYGTFHLLRLMQTGRPLTNLHYASRPAMAFRMLTHWDNLNRTVETGYSGFSIWNWYTLPGYIDQRYSDYARANASVGINAGSLNNVNANATMLSPAYLQKVKALADVFRPYGIRDFLTARFSAPLEIGELQTAVGRCHMVAGCLPVLFSNIQ